MAGFRSSDAAVSPVVGVVLVVGLTVLLSVSVGTLVSGPPGEPRPTARLTVSIDASADRIALTHNHGDTLAVTELNMTVRVDGTALSHQPPLPFFAAHGFESGPTGPFNNASANTWRAGETATLRLASTNNPQIHPGATVSVWLATDEGVVHRETTRAT